MQSGGGDYFFYIFLNNSDRFLSVVWNAFLVIPYESTEKNMTTFFLDFVSNRSKLF